MNSGKKSFLRVALLLSALTAASFTTQAEDWSGSCKVAFSGKSTLHNFDGTVDAEPFTVSISNLDDPSNAEASATVTVKVKKMKTGNDKRDVEMLKSLDAGNFPEIKVNVSDLKPAATNPKMEGDVPQPTKIPFTLALKGKTFEMTGNVSGWSYSGDTITCNVSFPVSLKASDIHPPSVLGVVKVKDTIDVQASLRLQKN